jgi:hypothetical protein
MINLRAASLDHLVGAGEQRRWRAQRTVAMLAAGMNKKRRTYQPRIVGGQVICRSKAPSLERMGPVFDREDLTLLDHHFMSGVAQPAFMSTRANSR